MAPSSNLVSDLVHIPVMNLNPDRLSITSIADVDVLRTELLVLAVHASQTKPWVLPLSLRGLNHSLRGALEEAIQTSSFQAAAGKTTEMIIVPGANVRRVVMYGLGSDDEFAESLRKAAAYTIEKARGIASVNSVSLFIDGEVRNVAQIVEAATLATFVDMRFKGKKSQDSESTAPTELVLVGVRAVDQRQVVRGQTIAAGVIAAKELQAAPANCLTPERLADAAHVVAEKAGLEIMVLDRQEIIRRKMGCYLAVTQGSLREPQFIHLTYRGNNPGGKKLALVGKAITHDTGGYSLKTGPSIAVMKTDMSGSAAVLMCAYVVGQLRPEGLSEVHFIAPACENMISEKAVHPGDVVSASNGKTVELMNTDAEGRLCLADALVYAEKLGVDAIVDIATLTGSVSTALGNKLAGYFTNSDDMAVRYEKAGKEADEPCWRMPLVKSYSSKLLSKCADLRNIATSRGGGAITAALFLSEFVTCKEWLHCDMASVDLDDKGMPTGYGVRTLFHMIESFM